MTQPCIAGLFDMPLSPVPQLKSPVAVEIARLNAAAERVLARLQDGRWHTNGELSRLDCGGLRFGGRLHELRHHGHAIQKRQVGASGTWEYRLSTAPSEK